MMCLDPKLRGQDLQVSGLTFKKLFSPQQDVDFDSVLRLLLKFGADPRQESRGRHPIFKALKQSVQTFKIFIDYDDRRRETVNLRNGRGLTPLMKLASQQESEENLQKISILLEVGAHVPKTINEAHPVRLAVES
mmetsp:Transcript_34867/g.53534  ORF Transcript_34867/g.53534 Transcript_34867/m.53534 type:complete len:135 (-) Transcript_34867:75-479(-)